jgi:transposase
VEAIVWLDRTGVPWRDLPGQFGPWATLASRFYRWRRQGVWDRVLQALQADADARGELDWLLHFVDGSVVRAHQHAAGARRRPPAADLAAKARGAPADPDQQDDREREALGRSRGGYSTKLHLRVEGGGKPMVILATAGQRNEAPMLRALMEAGAVRRPRGRPRIRPAAVAGDKGYSFPSLRRYLRRRGIRAVIPSKSNQPRQRGFDRAADRERNRVERTINRLKQWRRVATRYEKREANYLATVTIAAIVLLWLE